MTEHTGAMPTPEHEAAINRAITEAAGGITAAEAMANLEANMPAMRTLLGGVSLTDLPRDHPQQVFAALNQCSPTPLAPSHTLTEIPGRGGIIAPGAPTCHRCGAPATTQWQQHANDEERERHLTALEQNIRASNDGRPEAGYVADRSQTVVRAVYGCDEHVVDAAHLTHDVECGGHGACGCQPEVTHGNGPE